MKTKITVSIDENIISKIDEDVEKWLGKNRSRVIESVLKEKYWDFVDVSCIIFCHDYKWDDWDYPFDIPKSLIQIKWKSIIAWLLEFFSKPGITNFIVTIPLWTKWLFKKEIDKLFINLKVNLIEIDPKLLTWDALKEALKQENISKKLIIANWDIYYWDLNLEDYYNYHLNQKSDFSFLLKFVLNPDKLWNIQISWNKVINFIEKPTASQMNLTNSWLYITSRDFLDKYNFWSYLEKDFFPILPSIWNIIWYTYSWEWEHIQSSEVYEKMTWCKVS